MIRIVRGSSTACREINPGCRRRNDQTRSTSAPARRTFLPPKDGTRPAPWAAHRTERPRTRNPPIDPTYRASRPTSAATRDIGPASWKNATHRTQRVRRGPPTQESDPRGCTVKKGCRWHKFNRWRAPRERGITSSGGTRGEWGSYGSFELDPSHICCIEFKGCY